MLRDPRRQGFEIGGRPVGPDHPLFVIAEIGLNHGGAPDRALALVDAAADAGASAVKLQTLFADDLVAASCPPPAHVRSDSLRGFFATFELDEAAHRAVVERARARDLAVVATPFSLDAVALLERVGVDALKIASGDLTWDGLIERAARSQLPLIISTGMASRAEASHALAVARRAGASHVVMLHCVSAYPVPRGSENLRAIQTLGSVLGVPVGLSDHGEDAFAAPLAVALGACLYERHLVLAHGDGAIDDAVSSDRLELAAVVRDAARARAALGSGEKVCLPAETPNVIPSRRGLYVARALPAGHVLQASDLSALRPAHGVVAARLAEFVGRRVARDLAAGEPLQEHDIIVRLEKRRQRVVA